jgi:hypothetical protein
MQDRSAPLPERSSETPPRIRPRGNSQSAIKAMISREPARSTNTDGGNDEASCCFVFFVHDAFSNPEILVKNKSAVIRLLSI